MDLIKQLDDLIEWLHQRAAEPHCKICNRAILPIRKDGFLTVDSYQDERGRCWYCAEA